MTTFVDISIVIHPVFLLKCTGMEWCPVAKVLIFNVSVKILSMKKASRNTGFQLLSSSGRT